MRIEFVYIDKIDNIDTTKVSVYDLNKRFIDSQGNVFAMRLNRDSKKVEVIKLLRTTTNHADKIAQKMHDQQRIKVPQMQKTGNAKGKPEENIKYESPDLPGAEPEKPVDAFNPQQFVIEKFTELNLFKERLKGILFNINNSKITQRDHRESVSNIEELERNLDLDGIQKIEKVINSYRELTEYPRSINYYIGKIDNKQRAVLGHIMNDEKKMKYILYCEMHNQLRELYKGIDKIAGDLKESIDKLSDEKLARLTALQRQSLTDAKTSIVNTRSDFQKVFSQLNFLEMFIQEQNNFIS